MSFYQRECACGRLESTKHRLAPFGRSTAKQRQGRLLFSCLLVLSLISALPAQANDSVLQNEAGFTSIEPVDFYFHFGGYFPILVQL